MWQNFQVCHYDERVRTCNIGRCENSEDIDCANLDIGDIELRDWDHDNAGKANIDIEDGRDEVDTTDSLYPFQHAAGDRRKSGLSKNGGQIAEVSHPRLTSIL